MPIRAAATHRKASARNPCGRITTHQPRRSQPAIDERISRAFTAGQNLYIFDFFDLARSVLALGGESMRTTFLRKVGEHLDKWNTQPRHRQAWKKLLEKV